MMGIRQKFMLGFGVLLAVVAIVGALTMVQIDDLGQAIGLILKQNYRSVVACQDMKESLDRMDSGVLLFMSGDTVEGDRRINEYAAKFQAALNVEFSNITLPGEREAAEKTKVLFEAYTKDIALVTQGGASPQDSRLRYFSKLQPLFHEIRHVAQGILLMNQTNMNQANANARRKADIAYHRMLLAIMVSTVLALFFSYLFHRWIFYPINRLIESVNEIRSGNFDLVVEAGSKDEIGRLSEAFNEMTAKLRQARKAARVDLMRTRHATEEVFKALPAAIVVLDLNGHVQISTEAADRHFGFKPGVFAGDLGFDWLMPLTRKAIDEDRIVEYDPQNGYVQLFADHREFFYQPMAVPIPAGPQAQEPTGVALILKDVTQVHEQQEMKHGVVSVVSHQLKTPLTSLRMSIHLLLEERVGSLNEKQVELLMTAREDSERLVTILNDLLDIHRIESGNSPLVLEPVTPRALVRDAVEPFLLDAKDKGLTVVNDVSDDLPEVMADAEKMRHVFANLLSNALRFTSPGGSITIRATREKPHVVFLVEDSGRGIPDEGLKHLFEPFYRVPGQDEKSGVGLGLAIVKEIVRAHGGDVGAESVLSKGSVFRFTLPLKEGTSEDKPFQPTEEPLCC